MSKRTISDESVDEQNAFLACELSMEVCKRKEIPESFIDIMVSALELAAEKLAAWENTRIKTMLSDSRKEGKDRGLSLLLAANELTLGIRTGGEVTALQIGLEQKQEWAVQTVSKLFKTLKRYPLTQIPKEEYFVARNRFCQHLLKELMLHKP